MIYTVYDGRQVIAGRCGDQYLLCAGFQMCLGFCLGCEEAGTLQNDINIQFLPGKFRGIRLCKDRDLHTINRDGRIIIRNGMVADIRTLHTVILQQISKHLRLRQVIDCYNLECGITKYFTKCQTADAAKTIDCYTNAHI